MCPGSRSNSRPSGKAIAGKTPRRGDDTIIISGGAVDVGVASTVYSARDHDYNLVIVRDACSNSHDDSMAALMNTVFPRLARVRSTDQVLEMIRNGNK